MTQIFDLGSRRRDTRHDGDEGSSRSDTVRGRGTADGATEPRHATDGGEEHEDGAGRRALSTRPPRAPVVLERELRRVAELLRVPVTNLLRAVLEDAVAVADHAGVNVETRLKTFASSLEQERDKLRRRVMRDPLEGVFAFQPIKLAQVTSCTKCKKELRRGEHANLGLRDDAPTTTTKVFVCDGCIPVE